MTAEEYVVDELQVIKINLGKVETELRELYEKYNGVCKEYEEMHKFFADRIAVDPNGSYIRFDSIWHYEKKETEYVKKLFDIETNESEEQEND